MKHKKIAVAAEYIIWLALALLIFMGLVNAVFGATIYSDRDSTWYIQTAEWGTGGLPAQPDQAWHFGSGVDFDTTGVDSGSRFREYGASYLATGLTIGNTPSLSEGLLARDQSANTFDGVTDYHTILSSAALQPTTNDFGVLALVRTTQSTDGGIISKWNSATNNREWFLNIGAANFGGAAGRVMMGVTEDGSFTATHRKGKYTNLAYNDGKYHLVGGTFVGDVITIYVDDGAPAVTTVYNDAAVTSVFLGNRNITIGNNPQVNFFAGDIAWVGYWQGAGVPDAGEIALLYNAMVPTGTLALPYPSLQAAVHQGAAGDTILVANGRYQETVTIATAFDYIGASSTAFGAWPEFFGTNLIAASGTTGMTVSADNEVGFLTFRGYYGASGIGLQGTATSDGSLFHHIEFDSCLTGVSFLGQCTADSLVNCTIDEASLGSSTGISWTTNPGAATTVYVINTIVVNGTTGITESLANATFANTYGNYWNNTSNYGGSVSSGTGDQTLSPKFMSSSTGDYRLSHSDRLNNLGTIIHSGTAPFTYYGNAPAIGAWEVVFVNMALSGGSGSFGGRQGFARSGWSRGAWGR